MSDTPDDNEFDSAAVARVRQLRERLQHDLDFMESKAAAIRSQIEGVDFALSVVDPKGHSR